VIDMTRYQVDSEAVAAATARAQAAMGRIQGEVAGLNAQLVDLQSSWTGSAASAFQGVVADWRATQARVEESLGHINTALGRAAQLYSDAEAQNTRLFAR
jgi:WXG100 family type VII secretion target